MTEFGAWLYAVGRPCAPQALTELTGVGGGRVHAVGAAEADGLSAVVSTVDLAHYGSDALHRNLEDLDWLAATARAHDAVVDAVGRLVPVVPARLATVFLDDERVRMMLTERRSDLLSALALFEGRTEWGVKAYAESAEVPEPAHSGGSGTAYLMRRKAQLTARQHAEQAAAEQAEQVHRGLAGMAHAARRHAPQAAQLTGTSERMILNGTYLVDDARRDEFAARVVALDSEHPGVRLELTGPWPPYSFAGMDGEEA